MPSLSAFGNYGGGVQVDYSISGRTISWTFYVHTGTGTWQDRYFTWSLVINGSTQTSSGGDNTFYDVMNDWWTKSSGSYTVPGSNATSVGISISCDSTYWSAPGACSNSTTVSIAATNYTISYDPNGGIGAPENQTKTPSVDLILSTQKPTWTGHVFKNWNTAANGSGTSYPSGGTYSANASAILYAQWDNESYIITYNANGGINAPSSSTKVYGSTTTLSFITPTRRGYTFFRWNTKADGTGYDFSPGGSFGIDATTTLYAIWIKNTVPIDILHDGYINIAGVWKPVFAYIKVGNTWYFVKRTELNVSGTWKDISNKL